MCVFFVLNLYFHFHVCFEIALYLNRCSQVNNEVLYVLGQFCQNLVSIGLEKCFQITDEGVECLCTCPKLQEICMTEVS